MNSKTYWEKREHAAQRKYIKQEQEYIKELHRYYDNAMDAAQKEIDSFYAKYASKEGITLAEAKRRVSKLDIEEYGRKAAKYVKNKDFSKQANEEMRLYNLTMKVNRLEMLKSMIGLEMVASIDEIQKYFDEKLTQRTMDEFERQAGILGKSVRDPTGNAKSTVNASFHHANFSTRLWGQQTTLKSQLSMLLQRGMIQGKGSRQLAPELRKMFGVTKYEAERLMRTELTRVRTAAQMQSFEENGFDRYMFLNFTSAPYTKSPVCEICKEVGRKCEDEKGFLVKDMMPGENAPPMHPGCRCSVAAYMDREPYEKWLDSGAAKNGVSFSDFESLYTTGSGRVTFENGYDFRDNKNKVEITQANWLINIFGGDIKLIKRSLLEPTPDYEWSEKYWELKTPQSVNGTDKLVHRGLQQIKNNPGGVLVDCSNVVNTQRVIEVAKARLKRSGKNKNIRVLIKDGNEVIAILK